MGDFPGFLALFRLFLTPISYTKQGPKCVYFPLVFQKTSLIFDYNFLHSTSSKKVVFFAGRSVQGFQKPYYLSMNIWGKKFSVRVATASIGGDVLAFFDSYIYI